MSEAQALPRRATVVAPAEEQEQAVEGLSRREFLNYAWLASLGLFFAELSGVTYLFSMPRFKAGQFGGTFSIPTDQIPSVNSDPLPYNDGKFWVSNTELGVVALYKVCTHLGCIFDWKPTEGKFICPCHGSQFLRDGTFIQGPAPRSLDRFPITVVNASGTNVAQSDATGGPVKVSGQDATLKVDTGKRINGPPRGS
ncbi:MAG: hypothetical protein A2Z04_05090 [Chloroflexi bacterium RBG_16_57_9]|nr:MAG: hypothetical protein A2Z04_05090 [Chloroflexi bacterium RBG_16_57_9]